MENREPVAEDPDAEVKQKFTANTELVEALHQLNFSETYDHSEPNSSVILVSNGKLEAGVGKVAR